MSLAFNKKEMEELQSCAGKYAFYYDTDTIWRGKYEAEIRKEQAEKELLKKQIEEQKK